MPRDPKNLVSNADRTPERVRETAKKAGRASGKARREKKLMSQIYADFLAKEHEIIMRNGTKKRMSGSEIVGTVMSKVFSRGDRASVSLMRELREGTEGSKIKTETVLTINTDDEKVQQVLKEFGITKPESKD